MGKTFSQLISLVKAKPVVHAKRGVRNELASCYLEFAQKYLKDQMVVVVSGIFPSVPTANIMVWLFENQMCCGSE